MTSWQKIQHSGKGKAPPHWLEVRNGKFRVSYRVRYRGDGVTLEKTLVGEFSRWEDARKAGDALIAKTKYGEKPKPRSLITSEFLCDEIVQLKKSKDPSTYEQAEIFYRVHIKPFLALNCVYASELNATVWDQYRNEFRLRYPDRPLFNHWKFFVTLFKTAVEKRLIAKTKLDYKEDRDDKREPGQDISDEHLRAFLGTANRAWRDRVRVQRLTGQRPSVIRRLKKEFVNFETGIVSIPKSESKNRNPHEFMLPTLALEILRVRLASNSPYFFPSEADPSKPMDKHLGGWHAAWKRVGVDRGYTPHDLRHTYLAEKVKTSGTNLAVLCYACDLSLDELMRTYVRFSGKDTESLAQHSDGRTSSLFGGSP